MSPDTNFGKNPEDNNERSVPDMERIALDVANRFLILQDTTLLYAGSLMISGKNQALAFHLSRYEETGKTNDNALWCGLGMALAYIYFDRVAQCQGQRVKTIDQSVMDRVENESVESYRRGKIAEEFERQDLIADERKKQGEEFKSADEVLRRMFETIISVPEFEEKVPIKLREEFYWGGILMDKMIRLQEEKSNPPGPARE